ncbi:hypothetical protein CONPUDRAFT_148046 [Coniophora puteana RWD-64-598 SS2]|uniref:HAM1-like N-terminal domain-containing protein n=1 Tax=Coniophora puteana (strain RWD-64-598) TaxID=741705 RepID=A0A5M3N3H8_CONPW|nr:uncharacterized protein CONPUDRAFT_148046 [Coniophora puteana RWD-64-598 SS2]EIW85913.1 hypothetical protein CONPUDRAFT_148046 [Coniophora puteana RWD-64-598 SS2]
MSLPPAPQDISAHPKAGSVVDPSDRVAKESDVDRKIRLYGVVEAFRQGRMPDNAQIDETLNYVVANSPVDLDKLSPDGRKLIQDSREIVETARLMVKEKNADELFQHFVWHTRDVSLESAKKDPSQMAPIDREKFTDDGQTAVRHLRTILSLVMTNSEVRKLLSDFSLIGRDLLTKGASKGVEQLRPDPDRLARVDEAAPQDQFITKGNRPVGPNETPVLEANVPGTDTTIEQHPRADDATVKTGNGDVKSSSEAAAEARDQGRNVRGDAKERFSQEASNVRDDAADTADAESPSETESKKAGFKDRMRGYRDGLSDRIPQQHRDRANDHWERGRKYLAEEYFPEERRDQFIFRGKKVIIECQKHDDYQEAIKWLLSFIEEYAGHGRHIAGHGKDSGDTLTKDPALRQATGELRTLLERFANGKSMNVVFDAINALIDDAQRDAEFRAWFKRVDAFIRKCLLEAGYVLEEDCNREGEEIRQDGRKFWDDKYKSHFDNLFNAARVDRWWG